MGVKYLIYIGIKDKNKFNAFSRLEEHLEPIMNLRDTFRFIEYFSFFGSGGLCVEPLKLHEMYQAILSEPLSNKTLQKLKNVFDETGLELTIYEKI